MFTFCSDLHRQISSHRFDERAEHSQPRREGWMPQNELCKRLYGSLQRRSALRTQTRLPRRGSRIIYVPELTLSDHRRHRRVWLCTLQGSNWCNLLKCFFSFFFLCCCCFNTRGSSENDLYFRNLFYMFLFHCVNSPCFCTPRIWLFVPQMWREINKAIGCWKCWIQRGTIFRMRRSGFHCDWEVKNTEPP